MIAREKSEPDGSHPGDGARGSEGARGQGENRSPFEPLARDLGALRAYFLHYVAARSGSVSARIKRGILLAGLGIVGLFAGLTAIAVAVGLAIFGIAHGLAEAFGGRLWLGELAAGLGVLILFGLAASLAIRYWLNLSLRKAKENYERRRIQERVRYGRDVAQRPL